MIQKYLTDFSKVLGQDYLPIKQSEPTDEMLTEAEQWLKEIYDNEFIAYVKITNLLPAEVWKRYFQWNEFDHPEMKLLDKAKKRLRSRILSTKKPALFKQ